MARREFAIISVGPRAVSSVVTMLVQRRVEFLDLHAVKHCVDGSEHWEIRVAAEVSGADEETMLVKRLNRLIDVVKVIPKNRAGSSAQAGSRRLEADNARPPMGPQNSSLSS